MSDTRAQPLNNPIYFKLSLGQGCARPAR